MSGRPKKEPTRKKKLPQKNKLNKTCDQCGAVVLRQHIARHIRAFHEEKQSVTCDECKKVFANKEVLKNHVNREHLNKVVACEICSRIFKNPSLRWRHCSNNLPNRSHLERCPNCCQRFSCTKELNKHVSEPCGGKLLLVSIAICL